jgi:hypothetical protein
MLRDGGVLASGGIRAVAVDAFDVPVDGSTRRTAADLPADHQAAVQRARTEMRLPSAAERIEARQQAQLAADRAYANLTGEQISGGHAFDKHVIEREEFPGVTTRKQFADIIGGVIVKGEGRVLSGGRTAFWSDGTVVIRNPDAADGGTAFRPTNGHDYFLGLH